MEASSRKRHAAVFFNSYSEARLAPGSDQARTRTCFHLDLWALFLLQSWILHLGRLVVTWAAPLSWFPLNRPGPSEWLHVLHCLSSPLVLMKFLERGPRASPDFLVHLGIAAVAMGTTAHLLTDSVTLRLLRVGFELHLTLRENGLRTNLSAPMVDALDLLSYYDDTVGHVMWFVTFSLVLLLLFGGSFCHRKHQQKMPRAAWILLPPHALYLWFLVTEGQTFMLFLFTCFAMVATVLRQRRRGMTADANGLFLILSFSVALMLVMLWSACWWRDEALRRKHKGLLFVPQPRAVFSLHLKNLVLI